MDFVLTPLTPPDIPLAEEIERMSHLEPWTQGAFAEELLNPQSYFWVARPGPRPKANTGEDLLREARFPKSTDPDFVGYICVWLVADELHILNVTVHPDYRRQGIASHLLKHALRTGREKGARLAILEVRPSNLAARGLYERFGFREVGERPNYYGRGDTREPALIMRLDLT